MSKSVIEVAMYVKIPKLLKKKLKERCKLEKRKINAVIVMMLERELKD